MAGQQVGLAFVNVGQRARRGRKFDGGEAVFEAVGGAEGLFLAAKIVGNQLHGRGIAKQAEQLAEFGGGYVEVALVVFFVLHRKRIVHVNARYALAVDARFAFGGQKRLRKGQHQRRHGQHPRRQNKVLFEPPKRTRFHFDGF